MYLQSPRGTVAVIYGFIVSPNNLYKGLNMAPRHDADDKSNQNRVPSTNFSRPWTKKQFMEYNEGL